MLAAASKHLDEAHAMLAIRLWGPAGRTAYMAALMAARANIFELTGRTVKTHRGINNTFYRLSEADPRFDGELRGFLSRAYTLKDVTDYGIGPERDVPEDRARAALQTAARFVACITAILAGVPAP
jgi:uncharacterized protein (UPF0332 family)